MSREIYVQAQADHIESLFKASPIAALEELIWNALDAGANQVLVDTIMNPIGGIEAIRVSDDGTGIDVLRVDATFGSLGGSWKRKASEEGSGVRGAPALPTGNGARRLHGRHGRGRFKAFSLGTLVEWRTTVREGNDLLSYVLSGDADQPGVFRLDGAKTGPGTGTEVYITNIRGTSATLTQTEETVGQLAARFALYLKSYPDVRIYFNGIPVTPVIVQKRVTDISLTSEVDAECRLEIIEWKRKFVGAGRLVWAGPDGFARFEQAALVRSGGQPYTAYLISPRIPALASENALLLGELNPEVRKFLDAAKKAIKDHFRQIQSKLADEEVANWTEEGSYPYAADDHSPERAAFDKLAVVTAAKFEDFGSLAMGDRKIIFNLLKGIK